MHPDGSPEGIKRSVENCLRLLDGKKSIDIFEPARIDKHVPLETTLKALEAYVKAGKVGGIALSEVSAATIQKAVKITKIVAVEVELSLWSLDILSNGVAAACAEHNIPVIAYVLTPHPLFNLLTIEQILTNGSRHVNGRDKEAGRHPRRRYATDYASVLGRKLWQEYGFG